MQDILKKLTQANALIEEAMDLTCHLKSISEEEYFDFRNALVIPQAHLSVLSALGGYKLNASGGGFPGCNREEKSPEGGG